MAYKDMVLRQLTQVAIDERDNNYFEMAKEVEEVYQKAKAFDEILNCPGGSAMDVAYYVDKIVDEYYKESEE
ncbi:DUF1024 family protein [Staphylococcus hominis]|uniref:DUF1024 family protein n=1 Tax=Staphylococcus hominis TaxID=1290 RepID=UPI000917083E|nr:DUF1024 family protein [Staphylococcus hominis]SFX66202.1 Protein of unknown function [Staphylococcus hominis]